MAPSSAEEGRAGPPPPPPEPLPGSTLSVLPPPDDRADGDGGDVAEDVVEAEEEDVEEVEEVAGMGMVEAALPEPNQTHSLFFLGGCFLKDVTCTHSQTRASQQSQTGTKKKKVKGRRDKPIRQATNALLSAGKAGLLRWVGGKRL